MSLHSYTASPSQPEIRPVLRAEISIPLCVDMDGTLLLVDSLPENLLLFAKAHPFQLPLVFWWLLKGRAYLKERLAESVIPRADLLPYRPCILALLQQERELGRPLWLATGANQRIAEQVAGHLNLFQKVFASNGATNLTGVRKRDTLRAEAPGGRYLYVGDSQDDLPLWRDCQEAILVQRGAHFAGKLQSGGAKAVHVLPEQLPGTLSKLIALIRPHHWLKNLLVFAPLFLSHRFTEMGLVIQAGLAFVALSCLASSLYIVNDALDIEADRLHARKRSRPLAQGSLGLPKALGAFVFLLLLCASMMAFLPAAASLLLVAYGLSSFTYSLGFKRLLFVDVVALAGMFILRILIGGAATGILISEWTLAFALFVFLTLALIKRLNEIRSMRPEQSLAESPRGYVPQDLPVIASLGTASSYASVLVYFLYINSPGIHLVYSRPRLLWLVGPILIYWFSRFWILVNRGYLHDDPLVFAFHDRSSLVCGLLAVVIVLAAI